MIDVERIYAINLDRRPDRWRRFIETLPPDLAARVVRFSATDGHVKRPPRRWKFADCKGCWGCRKSHERLLAACIAEGVASVLIFEDDAEPVREYTARRDELVAALPVDWQIVYLGGNLQEPPRSVNESIYAPRAIYTAHAVAIRGPAIVRLLKRLRDPARWDDEVNPDVTYSNYVAEDPGGVYCPRRWLFNQKAGRSDIRDVESDAGVFADACDFAAK